MKIIKHYDRMGRCTYEISRASYKKRKLVEAFEDLLEESIGSLDFVGTGSAGAGEIYEKAYNEAVERVRKLLGYSAKDITACPWCTPRRLTIA